MFYKQDLPQTDLSYHASDIDVVFQAFTYRKHVNLQHSYISSCDYRLQSFSQELSVIGIFCLNTVSRLELLKHVNEPYVLFKVRLWVLHCIAECREQWRPYPEELEDICLPLTCTCSASATAPLFIVLGTCVISMEPTAIATVCYQYHRSCI